MGRVEDNRKILEVWRDVGSKSKNFDEMNARLLAQQNAILADISRSLAVIADNVNTQMTHNFDKVFDNPKRNERNERSDSDDGEEKGL